MKIIIWPDPILKRVSDDIEDLDNWDPELPKQMYEVMKAAGGVGLSAIQVGIAKRVVVADVGEGMEVYVNPVITTWHGDRKPVREGCLSTPGQFETVMRYASVDFRSLHIPPDRRQNDIVQVNKGTATGLRAQMLQHELEHLDGIMYTDHLKSSARSRIMGAMMKLKRSGK